MTKLNTNLNIYEQEIVDKWAGDILSILEKINEKCYLLNMNGNLTFEECFEMLPTSEFEKKQRYLLAEPIKIIKYAQYFLLENKDEEDEWYIGEQMKNGNIEFYKCCENLEEAFMSI